MCDDRDMVCLAVASVGEALRHASQRLRADRDVVELATDGMALQCVQQPLQTCAQIVAIAVQQNGLALQFAPASCSVNIWSPKPCITMALRFDAPALWDDSDVVAAAVASIGPVVVENIRLDIAEAPGI